MNPSICTESFSGTSRQRLSPCCAISFVVHLILFGMLTVFSAGPVRPQAPVRIITIDLNELALPAVRQPETVKVRVNPLAHLQTPAPQAKPALPQPGHPAQPLTTPVRSNFPTSPVSELAPAVHPTREEQPARPIFAPSRASAPRAPAPATTNPAGSPAAERKPAPRADGSVRAGYLEVLRATIEKFKEYPVLARRKRLEGTAVVHFTVTRGGSLKEASLTRSSGATLLDGSALSAVRAVGVFPPVPAELSVDEISIEVPLTFRLAGK